MQSSLHTKPCLFPALLFLCLCRGICAAILGAPPGVQASVGTVWAPASSTASWDNPGPSFDLRDLFAISTITSARGIGEVTDLAEHPKRMLGLFLAICRRADQPSCCSDRLLLEPSKRTDQGPPL